MSCQGENQSLKLRHPNSLKSFLFRLNQSEIKLQVTIRSTSK